MSEFAISLETTVVKCYIVISVLRLISIQLLNQTNVGMKLLRDNFDLRLDQSIGSLFIPNIISAESS